MTIESGSKCTRNFRNNSTVIKISLWGQNQPNHDGSVFKNTSTGSATGPKQICDEENWSVTGRTTFYCIKQRGGPVYGPIRTLDGLTDRLDVFSEPVDGFSKPIHPHFHPISNSETYFHWILQFVGVFGDDCADHRPVSISVDRFWIGFWEPIHRIFHCFRVQKPIHIDSYASCSICGWLGWLEIGFHPLIPVLDLFFRNRSIENEFEEPFKIFFSMSIGFLESSWNSTQNLYFLCQSHHRRWRHSDSTSWGGDFCTPLIHEPVPVL